MLIPCERIRWKIYDFLAHVCLIQHILPRKQKKLWELLPGTGIRKYWIPMPLILKICHKKTKKKSWISKCRTFCIFRNQVRVSNWEVGKVGKTIFTKSYFPFLHTYYFMSKETWSPIDLNITESENFGDRYICPFLPSTHMTGPALQISVIIRRT